MMSFKDFSLYELFNLNKKNIKPKDAPYDQFMHYSIPAYDRDGEPIQELGASIKSNKYFLKESSILVSKLNPRINRVWKFDDSDNSDIKPICSTEFMVYENKLQDIVLDFYYHYFKSNVFQKYLLNLQSGSTGSRMRVSPEDTLSLPIPKPTFREQQKIAAILSSVDEAIEKTEQIIEQTETVKKGLMQQLLTKGIGHTEFKDSPLGRIPISWETKNIGEVANIIRGASPRPKGDPRYYGGNVPRLMVADITRDKKYIYPSIDTLTEEGASKSRPMSAGSLVMVCSGTVGVPGILAVDACIHDGFLGISDISNECNTEYLFYAFTLLKSKLDSAATHGGVFTNLTTQILKDFIITIPSIYEQHKIVEILTIYDQKIDSEEKKLNQLFNIKQGLMQQLLTGKVRVPINEDEEVPS